MINEILHQAQYFKAIIAELKRESSYYPSVLIKYYERYERRTQETERKKLNGIINNLAASILKKPEPKIEKVCYASTLVRIERNGTWYVVHCVESVMLTENCDEKNLLLKMMDSVYKIKLLYQIPEITFPNGEPLQDIDILQQSEVERIKHSIK